MHDRLSQLHPNLPTSTNRVALDYSLRWLLSQKFREARLVRVLSLLLYNIVPSIGRGFTFSRFYGILIGFHFKTRRQTILPNEFISPWWNSQEINDLLLITLFSYFLLLFSITCWNAQSDDIIVNSLSCEEMLKNVLLRTRMYKKKQYIIEF